MEDWRVGVVSVVAIVEVQGLQVRNVCRAQRGMRVGIEVGIGEVRNHRSVVAKLDDRGVFGRAEELPPATVEDAQNWNELADRRGVDVQGLSCPLADGGSSNGRG